MCAVVAEWLRRLTRNQIPSGSVGSSPTDCENFSLGDWSFNCYTKGVCLPAKFPPAYKEKQEKAATSGNRTRAARVAGEHSTTEPTLHMSLTDLRPIFYTKRKKLDKGPFFIY